MVSCAFVVNADGNRNFPYLNSDDERWYLNLNWTENNLNRNGRLAVSGKSLHFGGASYYLVYAPAFIY